MRTYNIAKCQVIPVELQPSPLSQFVTLLASPVSWSHESATPNATLLLVCKSFTLHILA